MDRNASQELLLVGAEDRRWMEKELSYPLAPLEQAKGASPFLQLEKQPPVRHREQVQDLLCWAVGALPFLTILYLPPLRSGPDGGRS
jgi:hypothetical protein